MTLEAIELLRARRDSVFKRADFAERRVSTAWSEYTRQVEAARELWTEHAALCQAIEALSQPTPYPTLPRIADLG